VEAVTHRATMFTCDTRVPTCPVRNVVEVCREPWVQHPGWPPVNSRRDRQNPCTQAILPIRHHSVVTICPLLQKQTTQWSLAGNPGSKSNHQVVPSRSLRPRHDHLVVTLASHPTERPPLSGHFLQSLPFRRPLSGHPRHDRPRRDHPVVVSRCAFRVKNLAHR
jgi:hypothetical protein